MATPASRVSDTLRSNSSDYELDIPNLPTSRGYQAQEDKIPRSSNHIDEGDNTEDDDMFEFNPPPETQDNLYGNIIRPVNRYSLAKPEATIRESQKRRDVSEGLAERETLGCYTQLKRSQVHEEDIYDSPTHDARTTVMENQHHIGSDSPQAEDGNNKYVTNYTIIDDDSGLVNGGLTSSPNRGTESSAIPWTERKTLYRKYMRMRMVGMDGKCCCNKGARIFRISLILFLLVFIFASGGIAIGVYSWKSFQSITQSLNEELDNQTRSFLECRVGRNWTSLPRINSSRTYRMVVWEGEEAETLNISLNPLLENANASIEMTKQVLLYVIARTINNSSSNSTNSGESYINIALWTNFNRNTSFGQSFFQYMTLLNLYPQITAQNYWLPLQGTMDVNVYISAERQDRSLGGALTPINISIYLIGYC